MADINKTQGSSSRREGQGREQNKDSGGTQPRSVHNGMAAEYRGPCIVPDDS